jgi:hypothetical protein
MPFSIRPSRRLSLAYCLGFWLLITLLVLSSGPAYAEWVEIDSSDSNGGYTAHVDPDTIRRKGDLVKMWYLFDYKTQQTMRNGSYLSERAQGQFDCAEERFRLLALMYSSGNMGIGNTIYTDLNEGKWAPVAPKSIGEVMWKAACRK